MLKNSFIFQLRTVISSHPGTAASVLLTSFGDFLESWRRESMSSESPIAAEEEYDGVDVDEEALVDMALRF